MAEAMFDKMQRIFFLRIQVRGEADPLRGPQNVPNGVLACEQKREEAECCTDGSETISVEDMLGAERIRQIFNRQS